MEEVKPRQRRWQFGLRGLLLLVVFFAIGLSVYRAFGRGWPLLGGRLWVGATIDDVAASLGKPTATWGPNRRETWAYFYPIEVNSGRSERRVILVHFQRGYVASAWDARKPVHAGTKP